MSENASGSWTSRQRIGVGLGIAALIVGLIAVEAAWTRSVRGAVRSFAGLITAANDGNLEAAEALCTRAYRQREPLRLADEGGIVGLPRNVNKNFQAWRQGSQVWICPTNRVGPVYRFIYEDDAWKFDGPIGLLMPDGHVEPLEARPIEDEITPDPT